MINRLTYVLFVVFAYPIIMACDCANKQHYQEYMETSVITTGEILSIENDLESCYKGFCNSIFVTVKVDKVYKGKVGETITLHTANFPSACGIPFTLNKTYLFYLKTVGEYYHSNLCTRTTSNHKEIKQLISEIAQIQKQVLQNGGEKIK